MLPRLTPLPLPHPGPPGPADSSLTQVKPPPPPDRGTPNGMRLGRGVLGGGGMQKASLDSGQSEVSPAAELPMDTEASAEAAAEFSFSVQGCSPHFPKGGVGSVAPQ